MYGFRESRRRLREEESTHTLHLRADAETVKSLSDSQRAIQQRIAEKERELRGDGSRPMARSKAAPEPTRGPNRRRYTKSEQAAVAREKWNHILWCLVLVSVLMGLLTVLSRILHS